MEKGLTVAEQYICVNGPLHGKWVDAVGSYFKPPTDEGRYWFRRLPGTDLGYYGWEPPDPSEAWLRAQVEPSKRVPVGACVTPNGRIDCHGQYVQLSGPVDSEDAKWVCAFCKEPV